MIDYWLSCSVKTGHRSNSASCRRPCWDVCVRCLSCSSVQKPYDNVSVYREHLELLWFERHKRLPSCLTSDLRSVWWGLIGGRCSLIGAPFFFKEWMILIIIMIKFVLLQASCWRRRPARGGVLNVFLSVGRASRSLEVAVVRWAASCCCCLTLGGGVVMFLSLDSCRRWRPTDRHSLVTIHWWRTRSVCRDGLVCYLSTLWSEGSSSIITWWADYLIYSLMKCLSRAAQFITILS